MSLLLPLRAPRNKRMLLSAGMHVALLLAATSGIEAQRVGTPEERTITEVLSIYSGLSRPTVDTLVTLDKILRRVAPCCFTALSVKRPAAAFWREEFRRIGIEVDIWDNEFMQYNGKLLLDAHRLDPRARRSETLYASTFPRDEGRASETSWGVPSPDSLAQYLREFPRGPHAVEVMRLQAYLYADLATVLLELAQVPADARSGKEGCFAGLIRPGVPFGLQYDQARKRAIAAYAAWRRLDRRDPNARAGFRSSNEYGWHFCPD